MPQTLNHIAIIMDGNGRWATEKGQPRTAGHLAGVETLTNITAAAARRGVKWLTLYAFSTENWNRPADEVAALMGLVLTHLTEELFDKNNIRMRVIGDRARLPQAVQQKLDDMERHTAQHDRMTVVLAISYSARWEITEAARHIAAEGINPADITEDTITQHLQTAFMPDPDLLIRTGGEQRVSNFLLWQAAYAELYYTPVYWPDFGETDLDQAIAYYNTRQRRFGKTEAQVEQA